MTGCDVVEVLEAAHIYRYMGMETNVVSNGILLRSDLHTLFDMGLVSVNTETMQICAAPSLARSCYGELSGRSLSIPALPGCSVDKHLLKRHRDLCDW
ncbi:HNH endonuclease [Stenotrophomonas sp.]|uniref:HNH endonuclease n=1 Tax=Stenotrophomonas sp. TaxID=69392 RepID=UPI003D10E64D